MAFDNQRISTIVDFIHEIPNNFLHEEETKDSHNAWNDKEHGVFLVSTTLDRLDNKENQEPKPQKWKYLLCEEQGF